MVPRVLRGLALAAAMVAMATVGRSAPAGERGPTVVELFTSQGCNSCPPADDLLAELAERRDVLALSFHVDYWDYIGWKDPYASPSHTQRQRAYARQFGLGYVDTPQMVIDGAVQVMGSDRDKVLETIGGAADRPSVPLEVVPADDGRMQISLPHRPGSEDATVWFVVFDRQHVTEVKRGENRGRTLRNANVVRGFQRIAIWRGEAMEVPVAINDLSPEGGDDCAVLLQSQRNGRIIGAAKAALTMGGK